MKPPERIWICNHLSFYAYSKIKYHDYDIEYRRYYPDPIAQLIALALSGITEVKCQEK